MTIPLDPGAGGRSIGLQALLPGDILVSTTDEWVSRGIRDVTDSEVSHSMLYLGEGTVVHAVGQGVVEQSLDDAVDGSWLVVAYRKAGLDETAVRKIVAFSREKVGRGYDYAAIGGLLLVETSIFIEKDDMTSLQDEDRFFCSELVAEAFAHGGAPLFSGTSSAVTPAYLAERRIWGGLRYVGHLKSLRPRQELRHRRRFRPRYMGGGAVMGEDGIIRQGPGPKL